MSQLLMAGQKPINCQKQSSLEGNICFREKPYVVSPAFLLNSEPCICLWKEEGLQGSLYVHLFRLIQGIQACLTHTVAA